MCMSNEGKGECSADLGKDMYEKTKRLQYTKIVTALTIESFIWSHFFPFFWLFAFTTFHFSEDHFL